MSYDEKFEEAGANFWHAAKALISLKSVGLLDAAAAAMKQQAREFAAGINGQHAGCGCSRCVELREQLAIRKAWEEPQFADAHEPAGH